MTLRVWSVLWIGLKGLRGFTLFDLKSATDRWPLNLQSRLVRLLLSLATA